LIRSSERRERKERKERREGKSKDEERMGRERIELYRQLVD